MGRTFNVFGTSLLLPITLIMDASNPAVAQLPGWNPTGDVFSLVIWIILHYPHDGYVHVNAMHDGAHGTYQEKDSPYPYNNKALKIILDRNRSSYVGNGWWGWPNHEDTVPYS